MDSLLIMWGVLCYEFRMQIRRPALWLVFLGCAFLIGRTILGLLHNPEFASKHLSTLQLAATFTLLTNWLAPLAVGILLADRLPRDRRTRVEELLNTLPGTLKARIVGKYLGTFLAAFTPAFLLYLLLIGFASWQTGNFLLIPDGLLCYLAIVLPGMLFVSAFSLALPVVIWGPLYQFLFFGYWFWGNLLNPNSGLPTLSGTLLTPIGSFTGANLFHIPNFGGITSAAIQSTSPLMGMSSIAVLLGSPILVLVTLYQFLRWEQARQ